MERFFPYDNPTENEQSSRLLSLLNHDRTQTSLWANGVHWVESGVMNNAPICSVSSLYPLNPAPLSWSFDSDSVLDVLNRFLSLSALCFAQSWFPPAQHNQPYKLPVIPSSLLYHCSYSIPLSMLCFYKAPVLLQLISMSHTWAHWSCDRAFCKQWLDTVLCAVFMFLDSCVWNPCCPIIELPHLIENILLDFYSSSLFIWICDGLC